ALKSRTEPCRGHAPCLTGITEAASVGGLMLLRLWGPPNFLLWHSAEVRAFAHGCLLSGKCRPRASASTGAPTLMIRSRYAALPRPGLLQKDNEAASMGRARRTGDFR